MGLVFVFIQLPCLLVTAFKRLIFKVIIDRNVFSAILLLGYFPVFFLSLFLLHASPLILVVVLI